MVQIISNPFIIINSSSSSIHISSTSLSSIFSTKTWRHRCPEASYRHLRPTTTVFRPREVTMLTLPCKKIKDRAVRSGGKRILIKINVLGSSGPVRVVVSENMVVASVIKAALKTYAHEGRFPLLGTKVGDFFLYTPVAGTEALNPKDMIGSFGVRSFVLCKKPRQVVETTRKSSSKWKSWFNKTLNLKVTPH